MCCLIDLIKWFGSEQANNFGNFILGIAAIYGVFSYQKFKKQERYKKKSDVAEKVLNKLDVFKQRFFKWLYFSSTFKREFINCKEGDEIFEEYFVHSKNLALRLQDQDLDEQFKRLEKYTKNAITAINKRFLPDFESSNKEFIMQTKEELVNAKKEIKKSFNDIHTKLCVYLNYQK